MLALCACKNRCFHEDNPGLERQRECRGLGIVVENVEIDWRELFFKYADHVGREEGVDFLSRQVEYTSNEEEGFERKWCTDEEWAAIQEGIS